MKASGDPIALDVGKDEKRISSDRDVAELGYKNLVDGAEEVHEVLGASEVELYVSVVAREAFIMHLLRDQEQRSTKKRKIQCLR